MTGARRSILVLSLGVVGIWSPAGASAQGTVQVGVTNAVPLPASNVQECTPPAYYNPSPTQWSVNPDSVTLSNKPDGVPPAGHWLRITLPADFPPYQGIHISWTGSTDCETFNGYVDVTSIPRQPGLLEQAQAWVQNIIERMKTKYDPCVYGEVAANPDCGQQGFKRDPQFWKANGAMVCAVEVSESRAGVLTPVTTPTAAADCIKRFPPPNRQARLIRVGTTRDSTRARAKAGRYRGVSMSLARFGQVPTKKRLRRRARALVAFLRSHKKPKNASPVSFKVGKGGRSATFNPRLSLGCENGGSLFLRLRDLPDPSVPLSVSRRGYFKLVAEDEIVTARIGGRLLEKRFLIGTFYLGAHVHQHGTCEGWVGFAARRKG